MSRICVFCGSSSGNNPAYSHAAEQLGRSLAEKKIELVYGGARVGLMGLLADTVLRNGGRVIGVIPRALVEKEIAHTGLTDLHVVDSMHARKSKMADLADGFIAMPGGFGTLEEFCEVVTWSQLGLHRKNCGILNVEGYYDGLLSLFDHAVAEGFLKPSNRQLVLSDSDPALLIDSVLSAAPASKPKWITKTER
jgi:uncharacterized protein (TIGR00730 family)